uniref:Uncharacterized protein n=1 Tax=Arundo donax TaxID=35708 RepID=A0A0A9QQ66_ARUDO
MGTNKVMAGPSCPQLTIAITRPCLDLVSVHCGCGHSCNSTSALQGFL